MQQPKAPDSVCWPQGPYTQWKTSTSTDGLPRNISYINNLKLDPSLQPKQYTIEGTHPESKVLFVNVKILDSTGREPYMGDVLIEGQCWSTVSFIQVS